MTQKELIIKMWPNKIMTYRKSVADYKVIDFDKLTPRNQQAILQSMTSASNVGGIYNNKIVPKRSVIVNIADPLNRDLTIDTFFRTRHGVEFEEKGVKVPIEKNVLIKGPLSEVYRAGKLESLLKNYKYIKSLDSYRVISRPVEVIKITSAMVLALKKTGAFLEINGGLEINTSYGGKQQVLANDFLLLQGDSFTRIKGNAFRKTYEISR